MLLVKLLFFFLDLKAYPIKQVMFVSMRELL